MQYSASLIMIFAVPALVLPAIIGAIILIRFRSSRIAQLLGALTLKPVIATPAWIMIISWAISYPTLAELNSPLVALSLLPGLVLTLIIVLIFRDLYRLGSRIPSIFLAFDLVRWLNSYLMLRSLYPDGINVLFFGLVLLAVVLPSAYACMALYIVGTQERQAEIADQRVA